MLTLFWDCEEERPVEGDGDRGANGSEREREKEREGDRDPGRVGGVLTDCRKGCGGAVGGISMLGCFPMAMLFRRSRAWSARESQSKLSPTADNVTKGWITMTFAQIFALICSLDKSKKSVSLQILGSRRFLIMYDDDRL